MRGSSLWYFYNKERIKGWVYVIKRNDGLYKIGHTNNPQKRLDVHRYANKGDTLQPIIFLKCKDRYKTETELHRHFKNKRITGEWFSLSLDDIKTISLWKA